MFKSILIISASDFNYTKINIPYYEKEFQSKVESVIINQQSIIHEELDKELLEYLKMKNNIKEENKLSSVHNYLLSTQNFSKQSSYKYLYVDKKENQIFGLNVSKQINISWNLNLKNKQIISVTLPSINSNASIYQASQSKIYHKYINPNIFLLITQNTQDSVLIELVDSFTGKILKKLNLEKVVVNLPIIPLFTENTILIAYIKKEKSVFKQEILSIEILKREIDEQFIGLLSKIFEDKQDSKFKTSEPIFLHHTYVLSRKVKSLYSSESLISISNKNVIIVYENNLMSLLDMRTLSARRPIVVDPMMQSNLLLTDNSVYVDNELPGYSPLILIDYKNIVSKDYLNETIDEIITTTTVFESTFIMCTFGSKTQCFNVSPDKTFDSLSENFNYSLIGVFVLVIFVSI